MSEIKNWMLETQRADDEMTQDEIMRYFLWMNNKWDAEEALDFFAPLMDEDE